jgi:hypothetical protein
MRGRAVRTRTVSAPIAALAVVAAVLKFAAVAGAAGMIWIHLCGSWTPGAGSTGGALGIAQSGSSTAGVSTPYQCPGPGNVWNGMGVYGSGASVPAGARAYWQVNAPQGLAIVGAHTEGSGMASYGVNQNMGWGGGFYWQGGGAPAYPGEVAYSSPPLLSSYFGWQIICGWSACNGASEPGEISVLGLEIEAAEGSGPTVSPSPGSLGTASGWVRGWWPVAFSADGPTGACQLAATLGGVSISQPLNEPQSQTTWHQCPAGSFSQSVNTASVASGSSVPLTMWARDAAYDYAAGQYLSNTDTNYVGIDNDPVTVSLSGPTDAPSSAGTQSITVTGSAGPSGVSGVGCSLDGAPYQWYPGASTQIPVAGLAVHKLTCYSANNARDSSGEVAMSSPERWTLSIREPTVSAIGFSNVVDALRCHQVRERVAVPAKWVTIRRHHKPVRVRRRAHMKVVRVTRCHARTAMRRVSVWKTVVRHGKKVRVRRTKRVRVVLVPHVVTNTTRTVAHGRGTTVNGWLGTVSGTALGGQPVWVLTAPDNGQGRFRLATTVTTAANGSWTAKLPAGPSRLVEAIYPGAELTEPTSSSQVHLIVPAQVRLIRIFPRRVAWGGTVRIVGQLEGGYLPPGGALVRLRIGSGSSHTTYGVQEHISGNGRFSTTYTFGAGQASVYQSFWFQLSSLPMGGSYPYAPADSGRRSVLVGGHPATWPRARHKRHEAGKHARRRKQ